MNKRALCRTAAAILVLLLQFGSRTQHACGQTINLQALRQPITSIASDWRFHPGDDPRWAQPGFPDSGWRLLQPAKRWDPQGYTEENGLAWFRFKVLVPAHTPSLLIQLPRISKSYQLYADGRVVGQVGALPPAHPRAVFAAARLFTLPVHEAANAQEMSLALRLWQDPRVVNINPNILRGPALVGEPGPMLAQFSTSHSAALLTQHGNEYTQDLIVVIIGAASLLLFGLTREGFYLWFAFYMFVSALNLPVRLASQHAAWDYFATLSYYIVSDFLGSLSFAMFLLGALNLRRWGPALLAVVPALLAEMGPLLLMVYHLPLVWANGIYLVFISVTDGVLLWFLLRGWRAGMVDAKLLLIPYAVGALLAELGNLGHFLTELHVSFADKLLTGEINVVHEPFSVSANDIGNVAALLGMLAVLVYRFARTSLEQQRLASALKAAHDIQHRLVPVDIPSLGGLHTEVVYLAAEEVGGDFCQVLPRPDGSILVAIGDVSGKGLQAAMLGTLAVGALRSIAEEEIEPAAALVRLNHVALRTAHGGFITCLCLKLSPLGEVTLANAGHLSPYLNGQEIPVEAGLPLGIVPEMEYRQTTFLLPASARLTLLSDGVVEARSKAGELFGFERTSGISQLPASQIAAAAHRHGQEDDITIITLDWKLPVAALAS